jgi:hypothetical protein
MITGLKIARGFQHNYKKFNEACTELGIVGKNPLDWTLGTQARCANQGDISNDFRSANDIIFAHQLLRIRLKGWGKNRAIEVDEFHHKASFLSDESDPGDEE